MTRDLAVIGAGYWGKNLVRNFHQLGALATICDPSEELLAGYADPYPEASLERDVDAVLADERVTKVAIAAPAARHAALARAALEAGKDVYVEKPLALTVADARSVIDLAAERGRTLMVGHLLRYHPAVRRLLQLVGGGELGQIRYVTSTRLNLGRIRIEENALWSFAPHDVSVILALAGELPDQVRTTGESHVTAGVADTTLTALRFPSGMRAHIHVSWLNPFKEQRLTVVGDRALAVFDDTLGWNEKLALYPQPVAFDERQVPHASAVPAQYQALDQAEPLKLECEHFLDSCQRRNRPVTDGEEGLQVLSVLDAAQRSLERDGEATVPGSGEAYRAHPSAVIDPGAEIGEGSRIWHFCHVSAGAVLGPECSLGQNVFVTPGVRLGHGCKVQNNVSLYTGVTCEDEVFLGPSMVFTNVTNPRAHVVRRDEYRPTLLGRGVSVGANATIVCGVTLGEYAFVGAGATVTKDVPAYALVVGTPARVVGWMSAHGERLDLPAESADPQEASCPATGEAYVLSGDGLRPAP